MTTEPTAVLTILQLLPRCTVAELEQVRDAVANHLAFAALVEELSAFGIGDTQTVPASAIQRTYAEAACADFGDGETD